jgi:glycine cleavage system aminomethyltransferase T
VGLFPEIDVLREQHQHHLDSVSEAGEKKRALQEGYEAEDNARAEALRLDNEVPAVTSSAERQDAINDAEAERVAALARFGDFIEQAAATFRSKEPEWRAEFARLTDDAEQKREAAKQMLAEADREVSRVSRLGLWLDRTIRPRAGRYESAPSLEPMESTPEAKLAAMAEV